jgi:hypothetical protein
MTEAKRKQIAMDYRRNLDRLGEKKKAMLATLAAHSLTPGARSSVYRWCKEYGVKTN